MFTSPYGLEDGNTEYLIAHHIVHYGEFPLAGEIPSGFTKIHHSPFNFYFLAFFLLIYDSLYTLSVINFLLQITSLICIGIISYFLFGKKTTLLSLTLFGLNPQNILTASYSWQPYYSQPFIVITGLFLVLSFIKKNLFYVYIASFLFCTSCAIYFPNIFFMPMFILTIFLLLYKQIRVTPLTYFIVAGEVFIFLILYFFGSIYAYVQDPHMFSSMYHISISANSLLKHCFQNIARINFLFFHSSNIFFNLLIGELLLVAIYLSSKKYLIFILLGFILLPLFFYTYYMADNTVFLRHIIPLFGFLSILFAYCITVCFEQRLTKKYFPFCILLVIGIYCFFNIPLIAHPPIRLLQASNNDSMLKNDKIISVIQTTRKNIHLSSYGFFQVASYNESGRYPYADAMLLVPLEKALHTTLTKVTNDSYTSYVQTGSDQYVLIQCYRIPFPLCKQNFYKDHNASTFPIVEPISFSYTQNQTTYYLVQKQL
jgi:hypothetical protein